MFIQFTSITDISSYFSGSKYYEGQITISQDHQTVDGRSQMGVYSLDLSKPIMISIKTPHPDIEENFYNFLRKWEVDKTE